MVFRVLQVPFDQIDNGSSLEAGSTVGTDEAATPPDGSGQALTRWPRGHTLFARLTPRFLPTVESSGGQPPIEPFGGRRQRSSLRPVAGGRDREG